MCDINDIIIVAQDMIQDFEKGVSKTTYIEVDHVSVSHPKIMYN